MAGIGVVINNDRKVALKFDTFPTQLHDRLLATITSLTNKLFGLVVSAEPSKTGKLRSTTKKKIVDQKGKRISGVVFIDADFAKAGAEEYGAHRRTKVKAHKQNLDHAWGRKMNSPQEVMVSAYTRQANIVARKFERGPLDSMRGEIQTGFQEAISQTVVQGDA